MVIAAVTVDITLAIMVVIVVAVVLATLVCCCYKYSKTSLTRPIMGPPLNGPFREVVSLGS